MAVEIVRRHVDLVDVGHRRDLQRLVEAVPDHVDDGGVEGVGLEIGPEVAALQQCLARGDRARRVAPDERDRLRIVHVELEPGELGRPDRLGDAPEPLGAEVEVGVEHDADIRPAALAEGLDGLGGAARDEGVPVALGEALADDEARPVGAQLAVDLDRDVGLAGREALGPHLLADLS